MNTLDRRNLAIADIGIAKSEGVERRVLPDLSQVQQHNADAMQAEIAKLRAENASLKAKGQGITLKITEKGGLSMYGLGRFPITLYKSQWLKLIAGIEQVKAFIEEAGDLLTTKD